MRKNLSLGCGLGTHLALTGDPKKSWNPVDISDELDGESPQ